MPSPPRNHSVAQPEHQLGPVILDDIFFDAAPASSPRVILLSSAQDTGRRTALQRVWKHLSALGEAPALLSPDALQQYTQARASPRSAKSPTDEGLLFSQIAAAVAKGLSRRISLVIDVSPLAPPATADLTSKARDAGYRTALVIVASTGDHARQADTLYLDLVHQHDLVPLESMRLGPDAGLARARATLQTLTQRQLVDQVQVVTPQGQQLYATAATANSAEVNERAALYALEDYAARKPPPREVAQIALRWQALVQRFISNAAVPRDVAARVIAWRNDAIRRAESDPEAARWLTWGLAAEAFRTMDVEQFQREFPEHGKLVERLQDAQRYAVENYPNLDDRARFVAQTRVRLAARLAEGRSPVAKPPGATKAPRTR